MGKHRIITHEKVQPTIQIFNCYAFYSLGMNLWNRDFGQSELTLGFTFKQAGGYINLSYVNNFSAGGMSRTCEHERQSVARSRTLHQPENCEHR